MKYKCRVRDQSNKWMNMTLFGETTCDKLDQLKEEDRLKNGFLLVDIKLNRYRNVIELTGLPSTKIITFD